MLAIVQARGGSKGLPRKNLALLGQHPLIAYSIVTGLAASTVTRLIVSTDCDEIAAVAKQYGAAVPFIRPAGLATDQARDFDLFDHALQWLARHENYRPQLIVQLRPTTPFRPRGLVDQAVSMLVDSGAGDCVRGVSSPSQNPYKMWRKTSDGFIQPLLSAEINEPFNSPRQELPPTLWQTGHIDVIRRETITEKRSLTGDRVLPILVDKQYCVDIDNARDLELANWILDGNELDIDLPPPGVAADPKRSWPDNIELVVFDFDGVFTDNRVWVTGEGNEAVACNRSDGLGISRLLASGLEAIVLSTEANPVVLARCAKLGLACKHNLKDKGATLRSLITDKSIPAAKVVYLGNDINDLGCMRVAGFAAAVADAQPDVLSAADLVLKKRGGYGAVRELCDLIMQRSKGVTNGWSC